MGVRGGEKGRNGIGGEVKAREGEGNGVPALAV